MMPHISSWVQLPKPIGDAGFCTLFYMFTFDNDVLFPCQIFLMSTVIYHLFFTLQISFSCDSIFL